jgi:hypothetical protein
MRNSIQLRIYYLSLLILCIFIFSGCNTFEYEPDNIVLNENSVQVDSIGFNGYVLTPPNDYQVISIGSFPANSQVRRWVEMLRIGYRNSEGISYHFHQDFIFSNGEQVIYFIPFQNKGIRQFRHTPNDIKERYLIDWARDAEFAKIIDYNLSWRTESDQRGHSTVILKSKESKDGEVYEEHVMTGDLNEMFIFAAFTNEADAYNLSRDLRLFRQSLNVLQ